MKVHETTDERRLQTHNKPVTSVSGWKDKDQGGHSHSTPKTTLEHRRYGTTPSITEATPSQASKALFPLMLKCLKEGL